MPHNKSKDLTKGIDSDKGLRNKALKIASNPKYNGYQRGLVSMVYNFFDKKSSGSVVDVEPNYRLANEKKNLRQEKFIYFLEEIFEGLI